MTEPVSPIRAGLLMRCPACGKGKLFAKFLVVNEHCPACGAKLGVGDSGDAPMVFIILIVGFLVVGGALFVEVKYTPPLWLHALLWVPSILLGSLALMPLLKSLFYALTYRFDAREQVSVAPDSEQDSGQRP
jgi:uncharacterized protein (DUF983 family)